MSFLKKHEDKVEELFEAEDGIELSDDMLENIAGGMENKKVVEIRTMLTKPTGEVDQTR